jgi:hypothetical protein
MSNHQFSRSSSQGNEFKEPISFQNTNTMMNMMYAQPAGQFAEEPQFEHQDGTNKNMLARFDNVLKTQGA